MARKHQKPSGYTGNKGGKQERVYKCGDHFETTNWSEWIKHRQTCSQR